MNVYCKRCEAENDPDNQHCSGCGAALKAGPRQVRAATPPQKRDRVGEWLATGCLYVIAALVLVVAGVRYADVPSYYSRFEPDNAIAATANGVDTLIRHVDGAICVVIALTLFIVASLRRLRHAVLDSTDRA